MKTKENYETFLGELTELSRKHGIEIAGCGCCGSPFLLEIKNNDRVYRYTYETRVPGYKDVGLTYD